MAVERPNTKEYPQDARDALGVAVTRAREGAGHQWRPSFAAAARVSVRSLVKLETGQPVGPQVYEAVARALPNWNENTPRDILEGASAPPVAVQKEPEPKPKPEFAPELQTRLDRIRRNLGELAYNEAVALLREQWDLGDERGAS